MERSRSTMGTDDVRTHLDAVLADVRASGAVEPHVTVTAVQVWLYAGGTAVHGLAVAGDLDGERARVAVAAQVQEWEVDELTRRGYPPVWPICPLRHGHGLEPDVVAGRASWVCPSGDATVAPIGGLGASTGGRAAEHPVQERNSTDVRDARVRTTHRRGEPR